MKFPSILCQYVPVYPSGHSSSSSSCSLTFLFLPCLLPLGLLLPLSDPPRCSLPSEVSSCQCRPSVPQCQVSLSAVRKSLYQQRMYGDASLCCHIERESRAACVQHRQENSIKPPTDSKEAESRKRWRAGGAAAAGVVV